MSETPPSGGVAVFGEIAEDVPPCDSAAMAQRVPISTLLSQALVAFTIEFDNEAEHRLPHRTTEHGRTGTSGYAPWLVSMAMWLNCMRYVGEQGIRLGEMERQARTGTNLDGMVRWGYISLAPDPADRRAKPPKKDWMVRAKPGGREAQRIWGPLFGEIEARWRERFGPAAIDGLRSALAGIAAQLSPDLPDCLPILGYGLFSAGGTAKDRRGERGLADDGARATSVEDLFLPVLLARVLLAFAIEFEQQSDVSLAISANMLRVLDERPTAIRNLPELTGVSKELVAVATGWLARSGYAVIAPAPPPDRGKQIRLNERGLLAQEKGRQLVAALEKQYDSRCPQQMSQLRDILQPIVQDGTREYSPLFAGLEPYPDCWRARVRQPPVLPHYPLVTHRGGYPDGS